MEEPVNLESDRTSTAERHVSWVRFALIAFNIIVYYTIFDRSLGVPVLAISVTVVAGLYGVTVAVLQPQQRFGVMRSSQWTTGTDAALIVLWLAATGGATSPFFVLWSISLVAIGYRYGPRPTVQATAMYFLLEAVFLALAGMLWTSTGLIRLAYIGFTGGLMAFASGYTVIGMERQRDLQDLVDQLGSAKSETEHINRRMQTILDHAPSIILEVDLDGRITFINRVMEGFTKEQVLGQPATGFMTDASREAFETALQRVIDQGTAEVVELDGYGDNQNVRHYRTHMGPLADAYGNIRGAILMTLDITEEHQQRALAEESETRQREVRRLEQEAQFRSRFINTAAHELNTPMTPLRLQMGVLRRVLGESEHERRAVDIMERNLKRLGGLVTDLLDATRLQEGQIRLQPETIEVAKLLGDVAESFQQVAHERGISLEVGAEPDTTAWADPERVNQILYNLLSNALKFTPTGGRVQCEALRLEDGRMEIAVTDTGLGLSGEDMARLFQPFSQVQPSLVAQEPGTGLGLYVARNLAQAQGGDLAATSEGRGRGSTFRLVLPSSQPEPSEGA